VTRPLRVLQFGLGPIGLQTARVVIGKASTGHVELVGAVDIDEAKVRRDLGDLLGGHQKSGVVVSADVGLALEETRPDVVLHTTSSFLGRVADQIETCVRAGAHVVSSTEELAYPFERHPEIAQHLDMLAQKHGVTVVGTGVNPGFAMDTLALAATAPCVDVRAVRVERVVDAAGRRLPLQRKVGAGITEAEFAERKATGLFGHIGLVESLRLVAAGLGWRLDSVEETLEPMIAEHDVETPFLNVMPGQVAGIHHSARGISAGQELVSLDLKMYVGAPDSHDSVTVDGDPPIRLVVKGGIFGDTATVALLVNTAGLVAHAPRGLVTMADLAVPRAFATAPRA
jgi:2,4-diaminopentanoate dehydrogenase